MKLKIKIMHNKLWRHNSLYLHNDASLEMGRNIPLRRADRILLCENDIPITRMGDPEIFSFCIVLVPTRGRGGILVA